jgi:ribosomal-protein-alanine N-acetyltransferase
VRVRFVQMPREYAAELPSWRYEPPYDCYDMPDASPDFFLDPANGYYAAVDDRGELIGYRCFGPDGRVPGGRYTDDALDTGGGLRPDLTGRGLGRAVIGAGLEFGRTAFALRAYRVTVAAFNIRALRVVGALGFAEAERFAGTVNGQEYVVLVRPERHAG